MTASDALADRAIAILRSLVSFDTTSRGSNLALIEWVEGYLADHGVASRRIASHDGDKSNLLASVGPAVAGGVVLSGHTDVVPVDGQPWTTDPWTLTERDGKLFGRGASDMKGFIALALAAVPDFADLKRPVHLALSYDEETGCFGAPDMIAVIGRELPRPALVIVGEPSLMQAVSGHKGAAFFRVVVTGREAHSSQPHLGVSANMAAAELIAALMALSARLEAQADPASPFEPRGSTLTIGRIDGGTAANILARRCEIVFDLRAAPGKTGALEELKPFIAQVADLDARLKARDPEASAVFEVIADVPPMAPEQQGAAEAFVRGLTGDNSPMRVVPFASEGGQFQGAGFSTVICGPGSIDQAHQPDEYVAVDQMRRGAAFMLRLAEALSS
ncbi:MAG TPA: acetylornithine deacetylase [Caulobacter sp.]|nr:acetylornithine deacetylase [Caulobacter sp.]